MKKISNDEYYDLFIGWQDSGKFLSLHRWNQFHQALVLGDFRDFSKMKEGN